jgi:hypothetical protein
MTSVSGEAALANFRQKLTGRFGLDLLRDHGGQVLIQLPVGVGKSQWMDEITREAVEGGDYDLVVVFCPTRQLLEERGPLRRPPGGAKVVNLRPRPARRCGRERDALWRKFEIADSGALGRIEICGPCPARKGCFWPEQYGKKLRKASLVYATQVHLERSPGFLATLRSWTGAKRVLTLVDESNLVAGPFDRVIDAADLERFLQVLRQSSPCCRVGSWRHQDWLTVIEMLRHASTEDLQDPSWRVPRVRSQWAVNVQRVGMARFGDDFRFLGYELGHFSFSLLESRRRDEGGNIQFSLRPYLGDCVIFSGTADPQFAQYRLGKDLASPFAEYRFMHPATVWYNLASPIGSRRYFASHAPQILDFFAELVIRRFQEGKRVLLIAKKCFVPLCAAGLTERFAARKINLRVVTERWSCKRLAEPRVVPLINYGVIGVNLFQDFDAAYCLTGFYVSEAVVNQCLQDVTRRDLRLPIRIETMGYPRRRRATMADPNHRYYDIAALVQPALEFQEHGVVIQAVGRVRPFTKPREVITFQMADLPGVSYPAEFATLAEARRFFGIASRRERRRVDLATQIAALRVEGKAQSEVAASLGISVRTVRNYERRGDRQNSI